MKTILNIPFNQFDERLSTLHEFMLLNSVSTIIMCSNEVSLLWKADVHLADTANCHSPPVCVWACLWLWVRECVYVCVNILTKHSRQKSQRKPEVIQSDSRPSVSARRNDRGSSDKLFLCLWSLGQHSSFSTSICDPCVPFFNILPSSLWMFYPLPNVPAPQPCSSVVGSACFVVWLSLRCLPKASISSRWV